jgi:hypothetical protein
MFEEAAMSLFKSQMFTDETPAPCLDFDKDGGPFGPTFGNHVANRKAFREPWEHRRRRASAAAIDADCVCVGGCG